jgi:catechol 2,3-dioxygenase-like lactoylglutathione lyase family enzyme
MSMEEVGVRLLAPLLMVKRMDDSLRFYVDGLGFKMTEKWDADGTIRWCWLVHGDAALMLQEAAADASHARAPAGKVGLGIGLYFICRDALAFYRAVRDKGISAKRPFVGNRFWVTSLEDPDGYSLNFESPTDAPEESDYQG